MGRPRRVTAGKHAYHVLNCATARSQIFHSPADYRAFEQILVDARNQFEKSHGVSTQYKEQCMGPACYPLADLRVSRRIWLTYYVLRNSITL